MPVVTQHLPAVALLALAATFSTTLSAANTPGPLEQLRANAAGALSHKADALTAYTQLRAVGTAPLLVDDVLAAPEARARRFLSQFGAVLGVTDATAELALNRISTDRAGNRHVHLDQRHAGLPVFGARLVVHMNDSGIRGVNGVFVPNLAALNMQPTVAAATQEAAALNSMAKRYPQADLAIESSRLSVYRSGLLRGIPGQAYLAREILVRSARGDVREQFFFDAHGGGEINRINRIHTVLNREIYTPNEEVAPLLTEGSAAAPADPPLVGDQGSDPLSRVPNLPTNNLYIFAGGTYDLYKNLFGREGYDDGTTPPEEQVQKSVYLVNDVCPNAYWNGESTNYCPGFDADDVVSHEWSHGYTEFTHGLIYQYQSGALNESYSDIFGEMYDLVNGLEGPLGVTLTEGEYFENGGSRWVLGEDLTETAAELLLRDMWDPDNFSVNVPLAGIPITTFAPSPGSVITSANYFCGAGDGGGVHTNSGVPNHAFAMLVDGKEFNGVDIPAIGMTRAAHIYFHAMVNYQVPSTNFAQHADALAQSCLDLTGVPLNDVLGNASADVITSATCAAVEAAMLAVEMRQNPAEKCNYQPLLRPEAETPALCTTGQSEVTDFREDWEGGAIPSGWSVSKNVSGDTDETGVTWDVVSDLPEPHTGHAAFVANTFGGSCTPGGDISASFQLDSPEIAVVDDRSTFALNHLMQSELAFDGGNLKFSLNGGAFTIVPGSAISHSPYNTTLDAGGPGGSTTPIAGEEAWSGTDEGESLSKWGVSHVNLAALGAGAGDTIRIRFEFGQDGCNGNLGWFVDDVTVSHCEAGARDTGVIGNPALPTGGQADNRGGALGGLLLVLPLLLALRRRRR